MTDRPRPVIGIVGAGRLGTAVARQSLKAGYAVMISNSRGPQSLELMLGILLPGAVALSIHEVIQKSDIVVLAMPLNQYRTVQPEWVAGKIVIDAMNYWPPTEGAIPEFMNDHIGSSEYLQQYFKDALLVKTLNHVAYNEIEEHSLPATDSRRRGISLAGDNDDAKRQVEQFIDALGFDPVDAGDLRHGRQFQPDTKLFNARLTKEEMTQLLNTPLVL